MITMVKQRAKNDCFLACLAMITGKPYEKMFSKKFCKIIEDDGGTSGENLVKAMKLAGIKKQDYSNVHTERMSGLLSYKQLIWGRKAILQVPSLNYEKGQHAVVWDGEKILDPSNLQVYKWIEHAFPVYVMVFRET